MSHLRSTPPHGTSKTSQPTKSQRTWTYCCNGLQFPHHPTGEKLVSLHFIDEASKYHTAKNVREGRVRNYSDLGNCDAQDLIAAIQEWSRYMSHPACFHVDEEGCFHSEQFKDYCGLKSIEVKMAAGEAHWQNGVVERHIGTFRELHKKLMMEDVFEGADNQTIVDNVCETQTKMDPTTGPRPVNGSWVDQDTHLSTPRKHSRCSQKDQLLRNT